MDWLTHEIGLRIKQVCKGLDIPVGDLSRLAQTIPSLAIDLQGLAFDVRGQDYIFLDHKAPAREKNWVLAHELGHILLGHLRADPAERNESPCGEVVYRELLADVFSTVLIALCAYGALDNNTEGKENKNGH